MADPSISDPPALALAQLRAAIAREREQAETLMRQHFWRTNAEFWARETRLSRGRNYIAAAVASTLTGVLISVLRHLP